MCFCFGPRTRVVFKALADRPGPRKCRAANIVTIAHHRHLNRHSRDHSSHYQLPGSLLTSDRWHCRRGSLLGGSPTPSRVDAFLLSLGSLFGPLGGPLCGGEPWSRTPEHPNTRLFWRPFSFRGRHAPPDGPTAWPCCPPSQPSSQRHGCRRGGLRQFRGPSASIRLQSVP